MSSRVRSSGKSDKSSGESVARGEIANMQNTGKSGGDGWDLGLDESKMLEKTIPGFARAACDQPDTQTMVQCDECDQWYHFVCVGVTSGIADDSWSCAKCSIASGIQQITISSTRTSAAKIPEQHSKHRSGGTGRQVPFTSTPPSHQAAKALLELTKYQKPGTSDQRQNPNKQFSSTFRTQHTAGIPVLDGVNLSSVGYPNASKASSVSSSKMSHQSLARLKLQKLEEERELNRREAEKERLYLEQKYSLLEEMASSKGSEAGSDTSDRVRAWVQHTRSVGEQRESRIEAKPLHNTNAKVPFIQNQGPTEDISR
nr:uncharacterized protein LOC115259349 [Aedes albopictus]